MKEHIDDMNFFWTGLELREGTPRTQVGKGKSFVPQNASGGNVMHGHMRRSAKGKEILSSTTHHAIELNDL